MGTLVTRKALAGSRLKSASFAASELRADELIVWLVTQVLLRAQ